MPFQQPPSPVAPAPQPPQPWGAWISGGSGVVVMLVLATQSPGLAGPLLAGAAAVAGITLVAAGSGRGGTVAGAAAAPAAPDVAPAPVHQHALEALPDPVLAIEGGEPDDIAGRQILFANRAARDLLRTQGRGALLTTAVRDPAVLEAVDEALYGGVERVTEHEPGGAQDRFWRVLTRPLPAPEGAPRALLALRDETDSRRMEQMRVDFLANASHELRTPLASLSGFIETLRGHARDDAGAREKFLDIMSAQAGRMSRLVADLLSLSRIELNEHIPPSGRVDLALALVDVIDAVAPMARAADIRFEIDRPAPGEAVIAGDRDEVLQVIQNLIDNAVKYSDRGGTIDIAVRAGLTGAEAGAARMPGAARLPLLAPDRDAEARYGAITVRDHGPGLAREHLPRLTERFYRVEGQKSGERPGTGLGLAIVKHIVNRHRGGLTVESAPGEGAAFTAWLPAAARPVGGTT